MEWIKFGFGKKLIEYSENESFFIDYNAARLSSMTGPELAKQAIARIIEKYPPPYTLMASGGVDSQAMILAWKMSGVPFRIVSARYNGGLNYHDLGELAELAVREDLKVETLDIDILAFHENDMKEWSKKYICHSPHILSHMYIASKITAGTIISSGTFVLDNGYEGNMNYSIFGLERYSRISGQPMVPFFWNHDQDLMPHFAKITRDNDLVESVPVVTSSDGMVTFGGGMSYASKCNIFTQGGFKVIPQETKMHGFERIKKMYDNHAIDVRQKLKYSHRESRRPYDILFRYPLMKGEVKYATSSRTIFSLDKLTTL